METLIRRVRRGLKFFFKKKKTKQAKTSVLSSLSCVPLIWFKNLWFDLNSSVLLLKGGQRGGPKE